MTEDDVWPTRRLRFFRCCLHDNVDDLKSLLDEVSEDPSALQTPQRPPREEQLTTEERRVAHYINTTRDKMGEKYALHVAVEAKATEVLEELLDRQEVEADPKEHGSLRTPLHAAVQCCFDDMEQGFTLVAILLESGCDPLIEDSTGTTPLELCERAGGAAKEELKKMMNEEVAKRNDEKEGRDREDRSRRLEAEALAQGDVVVEDDNTADDGGSQTSSGDER